MNMMLPTPINFSTIQFPSDKLTVRELRTLFPTSFDKPALYGGERLDQVYGRLSLDTTLGSLIDAERLLAGIMYKQALGQPLSSDEQLQTKDELVESLTEEYVRWGIATGPQHAQQLIRGIEQQVARQVSAAGPQTGPRR